MRHLPNVAYGRFSIASLVTQEELRALQAAVVEVSRLAAVCALYACKTLRHRFTC